MLEKPIKGRVNPLSGIYPVDFNNFIPFLTGSMTPTSRFERNKENTWEITAHKDPTKDRTSKSGESNRMWRFMRDKFR
jgi:hypothetical protein